MTEFEVIERYFYRPMTRKDVLAGPGDDAALLKVASGNTLAITVDTLVESIHFPPETSPFDIGYKAAAVNLSDLAAMGASPCWMTLALTLPQIEENWLAAFSQGFFTLLEKYQADLVGGDLTRGPLSITVQAHGMLQPNQALRRNAAKPGDKIYVSGTLGDAAAGLAGLQQKSAVSESDQHFFIHRLNRPTPRVELGLQAAGKAHAAIDISDGFIQDLQHILKQSAVGATIDLERLPFSEALKRWPIPNEKYTFALSGGDDYELILTVPPEETAFFDAIPELTCIGTITESQTLEILSSLQNNTWKLSGYQHFK